jgi:hypothetical protein
LDKGFLFLGLLGIPRLVVQEDLPIVLCLFESFTSFGKLPVLFIKVLHSRGTVKDLLGVLGEVAVGILAHIDNHRVGAEAPELTGSEQLWVHREEQLDVLKLPPADSSLLEVAVGYLNQVDVVLSFLKLLLLAIV